jgi:long-chain acyl-CoA synthetase
VIVGAAGLNIYPEDLEAALDRQPEIHASCVVAIEGPRGAEPFAAIIPHTLETNPAVQHTNIEAAVSRANEQLAEYQQVRRWFIWSEPDFPRTATHKIIRREVVTRASIPENPVPTGLATQISHITGESPTTLDPSTRLSDLQLDSLGRIELLSALEDRYQLSLDEAAFTAATTVGDVQKIVRGEIDEQKAAPYPYPNWPRWRPIKLIRFALFYTIILPITYLMARFSITGREHLKTISGPVLFVANHVTLGDHALVLAALPFHLRHRLAIAMEGELLRNWIHPPAGTDLFTRLRWLAQYFLVNIFFPVFPLPKRSGFRRSFAYAGECIDRGESVLVFPEGKRAPRGQMHMGHFKPGIGMLAKALNVPVIPIKLEGLYELKRRQQYFADPGMVRVHIGEPVMFTTDADLTNFTEELQRRLTSLP